MNRKVESRPNKHFYTEWGFRREEVESHWLEREAFALAKAGTGTERFI